METLEILMVNEALCCIYGYTEEEYATMTLRDIRSEEDIPLLEHLRWINKNLFHFLCVMHLECWVLPVALISLKTLATPNSTFQ